MKGQKMAKAFQTDIRRERKKKKIKRFLRRLAIILLVLAAGAALFFTRSTWIPWFEGILEKAQTITVNDGQLKEGNFPIHVGENSKTAKMLRLGDGLVVADDTYINFYTADGEHKNSIQHLYADPVVKPGDGRVLVYENAGRKLSVMNQKETLFETETDGDIYFAKMASNNSYAVVTSAEGFSSYLTVYDKAGEVIYRWANSSRITSVDFKSSGYGCYITSFKMNGGSMVTNIYSVSFDSEKVEMTSEDIKNTAVIRTVKLSDGDMIAVCDDRVIRLDKDGKIKSEKEYKSDLIDFDSSDEAVSIAVKSISDESKSKLIIIRSDSDEIDIDIDEKVKSVSVDSKNTYVLGNRTMMLFSPSGKQLATANISSDYVDFVYIDDEVLFLGYREINKIDYGY